MMEAMLRSASARRRFGADASACDFVLLIGQWTGIACGLSRSFARKCLRARENGECHQAGEA